MHTNFVYCLLLFHPTPVVSVTMIGGVVRCWARCCRGRSTVSCWTICKWSKIFATVRSVAPVVSTLWPSQSLVSWLSVTWWWQTCGTEWSWNLCLHLHLSHHYWHHYHYHQHHWKKQRVRRWPGLWSWEIGPITSSSSSSSDVTPSISSSLP